VRDDAPLGFRNPSLRESGLCLAERVWLHKVARGTMGEPSNAPRVEDRTCLKTAVVPHLQATASRLLVGLAFKGEWAYGASTRTILVVCVQSCRRDCTQLLSRFHLSAANQSPSAPQQAQRANWAFALDPKRRYPVCSTRLRFARQRLGLWSMWQPCPT
jgi:hypothetical protein